MPRIKRDASSEIIVRWRDRYEFMFRAKRTALFFGCSWNELASAALSRFYTDEEKKHRDIKLGPLKDMPSRKYARVKDLPPLSLALYSFYTERLIQLERCSSMGERALFGEKKFVKEEWLPMAEQSKAVDQRLLLEKRKRSLVVEREQTKRSR